MPKFKVVYAGGKVAVHSAEFMAENFNSWHTIKSIKQVPSLLDDPIQDGDKTTWAFMCMDGLKKKLRYNDAKKIFSVGRGNGWACFNIPMLREVYGIIGGILREQDDG